jgi:hypothetical protein
MGTSLLDNARRLSNSKIRDDNPSFQAFWANCWIESIQVGPFSLHSRTCANYVCRWTDSRLLWYDQIIFDTASTYRLNFQECLSPLLASPPALQHLTFLAPSEQDSDQPLATVATLYAHRLVALRSVSWTGTTMHRPNHTRRKWRQP